MKPQQGRTARYILWALGFPLALWLAAALADAFSGGASLSRVLARFSVCMNAPFSVRWTKDTGRFLLLAGLLYPAGAVAVESGRGKVFKQAQDKTAKSILIGAAVRLAAFNLPELARVTDSDEMYIGRLGEEKRAIFCVIPDNDTSLNFLVSMLYTQAFQELYYIADQKYGGPLPVHVQCIQDEWANTPQPDNYLQILRTARSRNIGCSVVVQGLSAIKAMYKESWEEVVGNCDSFLFLGGNDQESLSYISKMTGKATIDTITRGETKGRGGSSSRNFQNTGRELVTPEELRMVDRDALLLIRGECPVMDRKYDLNRHPNIRYTEMGGAPPYKVPEDYCALSASIPAEDVQEEWKKGTPLAPELLSAFEVLHSKEELEEKKIERKKEQA